MSAAGVSLCGKREAENFMTEETWEMEQKLRERKGLMRFQNRSPMEMEMKISLRTDTE